MHIDKTTNFVADWAIGAKKAQDEIKKVGSPIQEIFHDFKTISLAPTKEIKPNHIPESASFSHYF